MWGHVFKSLAVDQADHCVLLTDCPSNTKENRTKMTELLFETFSVPAMSIQNQASLSLFSSGHQVGVVLDSGYGVTHAQPINGDILTPSTQSYTRLDFGGKDVTDFLATKLSYKSGGYTFTTSEVNYIKESQGCVLLDQSDISGVQKEYKLPDDTVLSIGPETAQCAELLFDPSTCMGLPEGSMGIHQAIQDSILKAEGVAAHELYGNVMLCGGSMLFPGMAERVHKELMGLVSSRTIKVNVRVHPDEHPAWLGGSILGTIGPFQYKWLQRQDYYESGPSTHPYKRF